MELVHHLVVAGPLTMAAFLEFEDELYAASSMKKLVDRRGLAKDWFDLIRILLGG